MQRWSPLLAAVGRRIRAVAGLGVFTAGLTLVLIALAGTAVVIGLLMLEALIG